MMFFMKPHDHPFFGKCKECNAASEFEQIMVQLGVILFFVGCVGIMAYWFLGAAVEVYK